jgi:hypothetical protein
MLTQLANGVWHEPGAVDILGMPLTSTMTVLRVGDGLLVHSPIAPTPARLAEVRALGRVEHLYAPNTFHHRWLGDWASAFPEARVHGPAGLLEKRPDLHLGSTAVPDPALADELDELEIDGFRLQERVLVHRPSGVIVVADLVHNIGRPDHLWTRVYAGAMGFYGRVALSGMLRLTAFSDRRAARASLDRLLDLPFDRMIVGHGDPVLHDAKPALEAAFAWLPPAGSGAVERGAPLMGQPCG